MTAVTHTEFDFNRQSAKYTGKVRDVYTVADKYMVMVATDRISAFDVILPEGIPYKGQVLNQIASYVLDLTEDIVPNWKIASPYPMVTVGYKCEGLPVEMIVRRCLTGSAWRAYKSGVREICGVKIPDGMREHERFATPIITPTTKAEIGAHDEDISKEEIIARGIIGRDEYEKLEKMVDTKYEFGRLNGELYLIDEIHTPDSSRYFYADTYQELFEKGLPQRQLSKEFVREWLMENGFSGKEGQIVPVMDAERVAAISDRYVELYEHITGKKFVKEPYDNIYERIECNVKNMLARLEF